MDMEVWSSEEGWAGDKTAGDSSIQMVCKVMTATCDTPNHTASVDCW